MNHQIPRKNPADSAQFSYSYSASQQDEIRAIRKKYLENAQATVEDKMIELRALDKKVSDVATVWAMVVGVISTLVLGVGMCLVLVWMHLVWGIMVGTVGIAGVIVAYPLYQYILQKERVKVAPRILQLTEELSDEA